jgi:hypothetical protein
MKTQDEIMKVRNTLTIPEMTPAQVDRFFARVNKTDGCWLWNRPTEDGYGEFYFNRRTFKAHRISYTLAKGQIPRGLLIDHMCRNRLCVNPDHLRAVDDATNALENSNSPASINHRKTHCNRGHELANENLLRVGRNKENRSCHECDKARKRRWNRKKSAENSLAEKISPTEFRGVVRKHSKWMAEIKVKGKRYRHYGFTDPVEAAKEYDRLAIIHYGDSAKLNFPTRYRGQHD